MELRNRRELLAGGLGVGAAGALLGPAGAAAATTGPSAQLAALRRDLRALEDLAYGEKLLQYCYATVLESGVLKQVAKNVVLVAFGHEQSHDQAVQSAISAVQRQIASLQTTVPAKPPHHTPAHPVPFPPTQIVNLFQHLHHEPFPITQLIRVEAYVQSKYFHAIATFTDPNLTRTATQILGCKAQQWSLFQDLLSHGKVMHTVPSASVRGSATLPK
jgi:hypothetical protein